MQETGCRAWLPCTHSSTGLAWQSPRLQRTPRGATLAQDGCTAWAIAPGIKYKSVLQPSSGDCGGKCRECVALPCIAQGSADPPDHQRPLLQFLRTSDKSPQAASLSKESSSFISTSLFLETLTAPLSRNNPSNFSLCWSHTVKTPIIKFPMFRSLLMLLCNSRVQSKKSGADWHLFFFFFLSQSFNFLSWNVLNIHKVRQNGIVNPVSLPPSWNNLYRRWSCFKQHPYPTSIPSPTNMHIFLTGIFFLIWTIFNAFLNWLQYCLFYVLLFWPPGILDLSSLSRD